MNTLWYENQRDNCFIRQDRYGTSSSFEGKQEEKMLNYTAAMYKLNTIYNNIVIVIISNGLLDSFKGHKWSLVIVI